MRLKPRILKMEQQQPTATPELTLILNYATEEERKAAEDEHAQYEPGPVKYIFELQEEIKPC